MKSAFLNKPLEVEIIDTPIPKPKTGEVRVKLSKIGVCGSDVHLYLGHRLLGKPTVIGHEGLGYIDKIGEGVMNRVIGERIVIEPNMPCGHCKYCRSGRGNICINKRIVGINEVGCYAEYICLPEAFCWAVPAEVSDADAVTIEPTAVAYHAVAIAKARPGDTVAVIGLGAIGLLLTHIATRLGYKVFVTEINEKKIQLAEKMGAIPTPINAEAEVLNKIWDDNDVISIFECAGAAVTGTLAAAAAPRGTEILFVGLSSRAASFTSLKTTREGNAILPSMIYDHPFDFKRVLQLLKSEAITPSMIISRYMKLDDLAKALALAAEGNESKIVIEVS